MKAIWVYITAGSMDEAERIGRHIVEKRMAACVNILDNMRSIYVWEGELRHDREVVLIAKTTSTRMPDLVDAVKSIHSYDCPCIIGLPVEGGNPDFLSWIKEQVSEK